MNSRELLRKLRRLGATIGSDRGKGGHVRVKRGERSTYVPTGSSDMKRGTVLGILKDLGFTLDDLR
jgi:predicted RNA binding protein YcfA (HicA-like mRNA interferase family)